MIINEDPICLIKKYCDEKRVAHSLSTAKFAHELSKIYGADCEKAYFAGVVHDIAKCFNEQKLVEYAKKYNYNIPESLILNTELLHGPIGALILENEHGIKDEEVLLAVKSHTTGRPNMCLLEKIIYISDLLEPTRSFKGLDEIRRVVKTDLDLAIHLASKSVIEFILLKDAAIHENTVLVYNELITRRKLDEQRV